MHGTIRRFGVLCLLCVTARFARLADLRWAPLPLSLSFLPTHGGGEYDTARPAKTNSRTTTKTNAATTTSGVSSSELLPPIVKALKRRLQQQDNSGDGEGEGAQVNRVVQEIGQRQYPSDDGGACSCRNPKSGRDCCIRFLRRNHKMGFELVKELAIGGKLGGVLANYNDNSELRESATKRRAPVIDLSYGPRTGSFLTDPDFASAKQDFRQVVVMRNLYRSLISGYLYHK